MKLPETATTFSDQEFDMANLTLETKKSMMSERGLFHGTSIEPHLPTNRLESVVVLKVVERPSNDPVSSLKRMLSINCEFDVLSSWTSSESF